MHHKGRFPNVFFGANLRPDSAALAILILLLFLIFVLLFMTLTAQPAQAQTFRVLHNFTGGQDGAFPEAGLTMDKAGNSYGTTVYGGGGCSGSLPGCGTVFKLSRQGPDWVLATIYSFQGGSDGYYPYAQVVIGPDGSLYGTTYLGGRGCDGYGCGTVFKLRPGPNATGSWTETVLYRFTGSPDGFGPNAAVVFDQAGNLYGTTFVGGSHGSGAVFQLTPSGGSWTENVLYSFTSGNDGSYPISGVIFDQVGNLYGTTTSGGGSPVCSCGTIYQLMRSGSGWTEKVLYRFQGGSDGAFPYAGLIFDGSGNLFGATGRLGSGVGGTVFELTPSGGNWTFDLLYSFTGQGGPWDSLVMDAAGNLYGTTRWDGLYQDGSVFRLSLSHGGWTETDLYSFNGLSDGGNPFSGVILDEKGHLYGTAVDRGAYGYGVVWEVTP
jgi:uncharacterized repeat protein (TIGR03803 family)